MKPSALLVQQRQLVSTMVLLKYGLQVSRGNLMIFVEKILECIQWPWALAGTRFTKTRDYQRWVGMDTNIACDRACQTNCTLSGGAYNAWLQEWLLWEGDASLSIRIHTSWARLYKSRLALSLDLISTVHFSIVNNVIEALIADIETDKKVAIRSLDRPAYARYAKDTFFSSADINGIHSTN